MRRLVVLLPGILFLIAWEVWAGRDPERQFLFASPQLVFSVAASELIQLSFWFDVWTTFTEAALGFLLGSSLGIIGGLILWSDSRLAAVSRCYVVLLGAIPIFSIAPMLIIWFGTGMLSKVVMAAFSVFFVTLSQVYNGASSVAEEQQMLAKSLACPSHLVARKIIIPGSLVWVFSALKMNISLALLGAFIGEFVSSEAGLGHYILQAGSLFDMPRVVFGVAVLSLLALILNLLIDASARSIP